jgi:methylthioribose-1-phosphate isomerase
MKSLSSMALKHESGQLLVLDQTKLPAEEAWVHCQCPEEMVALIQKLAVRGAPLIGVAAALALAKQLEGGASEQEFFAAASKLRAARPTAVNLMAAVDRMLTAFSRFEGHKEQVVREAEKIFEEDAALCEAMAERGARLVQPGDQLLTHCNAGGLATAGIGTALGVIIRAHQQGKNIHAYVDETRPLLQGARLTAWELKKHGVPHTLICDNMAGFLMSQGKVTRIFVGADRIAVNGDAANKIGTYSLAVLAKHHQVPFHVVAPRTTYDPSCPSGKEIPIEQRAKEEVSRHAATESVWNPAFDVTPRALITSIVFDDGIA